MSTSSDESVLSKGSDRIVVHVWDIVTCVDHDVDGLMASIERERVAGGRASGIAIIPAA